MSLAIAHFAVGALFTVLLVVILAPHLLRSPTVVVAGGVWGMLPDTHWVLPVGAELVRSFHMTVWANLFWFHHFLDRADPTDSPKVAAATVILLLVVLSVSEWLVGSRAIVRVASTVEETHG